jgi:hypothetical protein
MSWLITQKVLPSFLLGQPPSYQTILEAQQRKPLGGWSLWLNDKRLGWVLSTLEGQSQGPREIRSRVHFDELPLVDLTPGWVRAIFRLTEHPIDKFQLDARSALTIDPLGKLVRFDSDIKLIPSNNSLRMQGIVDGLQLHVEIRSGDFSYSSDIALPEHALINDALSPQMELPNLRLGQSWTVPALTPLWPTNSPMEILHAAVEGKEPIFWNNEICKAWLVVYRNDPGSDFGNRSRPRGKLWVLEDGTVIKQQAYLFDSVLSFIRLSDAATARLVKKCQEEQKNIEE